MNRAARLFLGLLFCAVAGTLSAQTQKSEPVFLDTLDIVSEKWSSVTDPKWHKYMQLGGVNYPHAFYVGSSNGSDECGWREYDLGGKYKTLSFIRGTLLRTPPDRKGIMVIRGDGRKLLDRVFSSNDGNERVTLDVEGVHKLRFEIAVDDLDFAVAMPVLWRADQTPYEVGELTHAEPKPTMLCRDLMPFRSYHKVFSSNEEFYDRGLDFVEAEEGEVRLGGSTYKDGLYCRAGMALIGNALGYTHFNIGGQFERLRFITGAIDTDDGTLESGWLTVYADGKILYEKEIIEGELPVEISLDVTGCRSLGFSSENSSGSLDIGVAKMMLYPAGYTDEQERPLGNGSEQEYLASDHLKSLPDVCKLISNIPPFAIGGGMSRESALFEDKSQHVTFSMGGIKYSEGVVLQSSTNFFHNNTGAHVIFNLGGEFDYVSFTTGWVGKCGVLKDDWLRVYADTTLVLQVPLKATAPNHSYLLPIHKCRTLKFEKAGVTSMSHPAFGLADMVVYRGEYVENDLFDHQQPECPDEIDLIDLSKPYIHYVSSAGDAKILFDGSTQREYFSMPDGSRIHKGFLLKTSVHFDMEMGPGSDPSAAIMAPMFGSSIMLGSVGGASLSAVCPFGAFLALAAGGEAHESSCAAFNTWGEYDYLTFKVACRVPHNTIDTIDLKGDEAETLLIGADGEVVAEMQVHADMQPTSYTVPIERCHQLMFWLKCGGWSSGQFIFYDLKLHKGMPKLSVPAIGERNDVVAVMAPAEPYLISSDGQVAPEFGWEEPDNCSASAINEYFDNCDDSQEAFEEFYDDLNEVQYHTVSRFVRGADGTIYRSFRVQSPTGDNYSLLRVKGRNEQVISMINTLKLHFATLSVGRVSATTALLQVGPRMREYRQYIKESTEAFRLYEEALNNLIKAKREENRLIDELLEKGVTVDGIESNEFEVFII